MNIVIIGLGKMGLGIGNRIKKYYPNTSLFGYDINLEAQRNARNIGITIISSLEACKDLSIDVFWLMLPAGPIIDTMLEHIISIAPQNSFIIDGGNSYYKDSQRRSQALSEKRPDLSYLDCGVSGGIHGEVYGFCCMVGGSFSAYKKLELLFAALSGSHGYGYIGSSGTGHYVKMIHNGIEYGLMQAYAEGIHIMKEGTFKDHLNLAHITKLWNTNAVIRSFLLQLIQEGLDEDESLKHISGKIAQSGMGAWTHLEAQVHHIPDPALEASLAVRNQSQETGGTYGTKIVALLRTKFGGHNSAL